MQPRHRSDQGNRDRPVGRRQRVHHLWAREPVRVATTRTRFLKEEGGFTLSEMLVTIMIMMIVFFALYSIFDMSVRIYSFGSNKVEAVESARLGLERMEREIRAAYPVGSDSHLFFDANGLATINPPQAMPTDDQITFGNEL